VRPNVRTPHFDGHLLSEWIAFDEVVEILSISRALADVGPSSSYALALGARLTTALECSRSIQ
jgi:hypothetical protein